MRESAPSSGSTAPPHGQGERGRSGPLVWLGAALFAVPFVTIVVVMIMAGAGAKPAMSPVVPVAFAVGFAGFALLLVSRLRKGRGGHAGHGTPRGMRGDHPLAPGIDVPDRPEAPERGTAAPAPGAVCCEHCGVWSEPVSERGVRVCSRCGAALPPG